jgi:Cu(I)/Ag(I) efflux system membrane fusion protein
VSSFIPIRDRRSLIAPLVVTVLAVIAAIVFWRPLVAWFTGKPVGGSEGQSVTAHAGPYVIEARLAPDPPREKDQVLVLMIHDSAGNSVDGASVDLVYDMPAMGTMSEMKGNAKVTRTEAGTYRAQFDLPMSGSWALRTTVHRNSDTASQAFHMTVGQAGLTLGGGGGGGGESASATASSPRVAPVEYSPLAFDALRSSIDAYDRARGKLARDDMHSIGADARTIADALRAVHDTLPAGSELLDVVTDAREAAEHLTVASSLNDSRTQFGKLSESFLPLVGADARLSSGWHVFECPMFEGHPRWMQRRDHPENPYMGTQMPSCGTSATWQAPTASQAPSTGSPGEIDHYTCSMHPSVKQAVPGTCPICGMNLIPVTKEQQQQGVVMIDEARRQLIGVRTEPVVQAPMRDTFRAVGRVAYDESTLADVNLKVRGWITKLYVNQTGQRVERGQTLFTMYSPELYNAEQDFLLATRRSARTSAAPSETSSAEHGGVANPSQTGQTSPESDAESRQSRPDLFKSASRQRLHLLGLTDAQVDTIAQQGKPFEDLAIPSPASGFVIEKNVVEGASVDAGMRLYRIAALSKVWVEAEVYESDLAHVRAGQPANVTLDYLPGRAYQAKVAYVYPYLDPNSRTGRVRLELANSKLDLRPGMYASVELATDLGPRVQVPTSAVVYTGPRRLVFVDLGDGRFRPTEVKVGTESNGMYEVLAGLAPGDVVATSGIFLIAAEARISTAAKYWDTTAGESDSGPDPTQAAAATAPRPAGASMPMPAPPSSPPATDYTCPMHPDVHSPTPGKCPQCGMDLEPRRRQP